MLYQCKQCGARFDIPDQRLKPEGSRFKCTKCGTGFVLRRPSEAPAQPPPGAVACPRCGGFSGSLARFCSHCGNPLAPMRHAAGQARYRKSSNPVAIIAIAIVVIFIGIVVLGMISAIAIPAFLGQREKARMRMLESNYNTAINIVKEELRRCDTDRDSVTTDVVAQLNAGDMSNPWFSESDAFSSSFGKGQVAISHSDLRSLCGTDTEVIIRADNRGDGIVDDGFEESIRISGSERSAFDLPLLEHSTTSPTTL